MVEGRAGDGKSTLTTAIGAAITTGGPLPGDDQHYRPRGAIFVNMEDGLSDSLVPRLAAHGADLDRCLSLAEIADPATPGVTRPLTIPDDLAILEQAMQEMDAGIVVIDPVVAALSPKVNSYSDQEVRRALAPLKLLAERYACTIILIRHLRKAPTGDARTSGNGSAAFVNLARMGWTVGTDPNDPERRVLAVNKSNGGKRPASLTFTLEEAGDYGATRIVWGETSTLRADDLVRPFTPDEPEQVAARTETAGWLAGMLAGGSVPVARLKDEARRDGMGWRSVERAKAQLGVVADRTGGIGGAGSWVWRLPPSVVAKSANDPLCGGVAVYGGLSTSVADLADRAAHDDDVVVHHNESSALTTAPPNTATGSLTPPNTATPPHRERVADLAADDNLGAT